MGWRMNDDHDPLEGMGLVTWSLIVLAALIGAVAYWSLK